MTRLWEWNGDLTGKLKDVYSGLEFPVIKLDALDGKKSKAFEGRVSKYTFCEGLRPGIGLFGLTEDVSVSYFQILLNENGYELFPGCLCGGSGLVKFANGVEWLWANLRSDDGWYMTGYMNEEFDADRALFTMPKRILNGMVELQACVQCNIWRELDPNDDNPKRMWIRDSRNTMRLGPYDDVFVFGEHYVSIQDGGLFCMFDQDEMKPKSDWMEYEKFLYYLKLMRVNDADLDEFRGYHVLEES